MNRRTAMMLTMLLGGLAPLDLWAQTKGKRTSGSRSGTGRVARTRRQGRCRRPG